MVNMKQEEGDVNMRQEEKKSVFGGGRRVEYGSL